jgi:hypothetical protein
LEIACKHRQGKLELAPALRLDVPVVTIDPRFAPYGVDVVS